MPTWENVHESCKFYLDQNEDYSPGDGISDDSEKLLQKGRGKDSMYVILVKVGYKQPQILQKVSASHRSSLHLAGF